MAKKTVKTDSKSAKKTVEKPEPNAVTTINILGDEWTIRDVPPEDDSVFMNDPECGGYCDVTTHSIVLPLFDDEAVERMGIDYEQHRKLSLRHELVHAALFSSGLSHSWEHSSTGHDETTVDWIAAQFPKLVKIFREAKVLD